MQFFARLKQRHRRKSKVELLNQFYNHEGNVKSDLSLCLRLMKAVPVDSFYRYHPRFGESKTVNTGIRNLDAFVKILQRADATLRSGLTLRVDWYDEYERYFTTDGTPVLAHYFADKTIDRLLVDSAGHYSDPVQTIAKMILFGTKICTFLQTGVNDNSEYQKDCLIVLNRMVTDLVHLSVAFIEMTLDE